MRVLVTAGPTREPLDPVRYLSNRSSGKMGYALAEAAIEAGHEVVLVSGPVALAPPGGEGVRTLCVETAEEMFGAVREALPGIDLAIFCAAVADYRPRAVAADKIKKGEARLVLELERTPDILGSARGAFGYRGFLVGFAAETRELERAARRKLERKGCDLVVANDVGRPDIGFDRDENEVLLLWRDGGLESLPSAPKIEIARAILGRVFERMGKPAVS